VEREWVTPEHRKAAKAYIQYLLQRPQQEKAIAYGFRPARVDVPLATPIDEAHGVDPENPKPHWKSIGPVIDAILNLWQAKKKAANVVLVMDTSGSMNDDGKIQSAREGAKQLVSLSPTETTSLCCFQPHCDMGEAGRFNQNRQG